MNMEKTYKSLSSLGKIITGKTPPTENVKYYDGPYPFITPSDITSFSDKYLTETERTISTLGVETIKSCKLPKNSTCFVCIGSTIGKMCMTKSVSYTNQQINSIIPNDEINPHYLFYCLRNAKGYFQSIGGGTGSGKGIVNKTLFSKTRIEIIEHRFIQDRIAYILSTYDNLIENNKKRIKLLEQMAENLYKEWFVRFRFPGHESAEFENGIPKGWEYRTVESLSSVLQRGISPNYNDDGSLTVISQKCIRHNIMDIKEARKQTKEFKSELNLLDGDTVVCSTGTGTLGRVGQVYGDFPNTTFDSHVTLVRAKPNVGKHFLFWSLKSMQIWFMNMGIGSTNQQELYRGTIKNAKILMPSDELIIKFERVINTIHQEIVSIVQMQDNLVKQRDLLLPRLMNGKLEV